MRLARAFARQERSLAVQSVILTGARAAGFVLTFAIPLVLVRIFSQDEFGVYKQVFLISATLVPICNLGLNASLFYFVPRDGGRGQRFVHQALALLSLAGAAAGLALVVAGDVVAAALAGGFGLLAASPADRRWAASALLGTASGVGLLLAASLVTAVYSDYAISVLPLAFVTIGGAVQRLGEALGGKGARLAVGASVAVLVAGVLPGTVSHASDGTRLDPRPAHDHIRAAAERGSRAPVFAPVPELHRFYAPTLAFVELPYGTARLERALAEDGEFWLIGFYHREGLVLAGDDVDAWIRTHCHSVLRTQRPRLDYRVYRVELHWCGHDRRPDARVTP